MMKATGIVRRIDDLGRIVIPKEIRRTLHIRESDPLEIFTDREGQVILKKYSPIGEMTTFAKQYAESLAQVSGHATLIADRDQFIAVSGGCKQLLNKSDVYKRQIYISSNKYEQISNALYGSWDTIRKCIKEEYMDALPGKGEKKEEKAEAACLLYTSRCV